MAKRFDAIREATDRAERTALAVRNAMENVNAMAHEIAATASSQALEATSRLLSQSEYLQNMLDDLGKHFFCESDVQLTDFLEEPLRAVEVVAIIGVDTQQDFITTMFADHA